MAGWGDYMVNAPGDMKWGEGTGQMNVEGPGFWNRVGNFMNNPNTQALVSQLGTALSGTDAYGKPTLMGQVGMIANQAARAKLAARTAQNASTVSGAPKVLAEMGKIDPDMQNKEMVIKNPDGTTYTLKQYEKQPWQSTGTAGVQQMAEQGQTEQQVGPTVQNAQGLKPAQRLAQAMGGGQGQVPFQQSLLGQARR